jgi:hypothetical protein
MAVAFTSIQSVLAQIAKTSQHKVRILQLAIGSLSSAAVRPFVFRLHAGHNSCSDTQRLERSALWTGSGYCRFAENNTPPKFNPPKFFGSFVASQACVDAAMKDLNNDVLIGAATAN